MVDGHCNKIQETGPDMIKQQDICHFDTLGGWVGLGCSVSCRGDISVYCSVPGLFPSIGKGGVVCRHLFI